MSQPISKELKAGFSKIGLLAPILFWLLVLFALADPMFLWLGGDSRFEQDAITRVRRFKRHRPDGAQVPQIAVELAGS